MSVACGPTKIDNPGLNLTEPDDFDMASEHADNIALNWWFEYEIAHLSHVYGPQGLDHQIRVPVTQRSVSHR